MAYVEPNPDKNRYEVEGDIVRLIIEKRDRSVATVIFDATDFEAVRWRAWRAAKQRSGRIEAWTGSSYHNDAQSLGRYLLGEPPPEHVLIYLNKNPLDCRRSNLRYSLRSDVWKIRRRAK